MRLQRLRLQGFKSFRDPTLLEFSPTGITMVIGPNGCGKSNIVDAIRWGLGLQSPRQLRGESMQDVIFNGTHHAAAVHRSEVNLLFDNQEKRCPARYHNLQSIEVSRRIYRGEGSLYQINRENCRLQDIRELLMDSGVAEGAYGIVEQGRIAQLIAASPAERRLFLEEAAGISRYKHRRSEAERKLGSTAETLLRVHDLLREIIQQRDALASQRQEAQRYRQLRQQRQALERAILIVQHRQLQQEQTRLTTQRETAAAECQQLDANLNVASQALRTAETGHQEGLETLRAREKATFAGEHELQQQRNRLQLLTQKQQYAQQQQQQEHLARQTLQKQHAEQAQLVAEASAKREPLLVEQTKHNTAFQEAQKQHETTENTWRNALNEVETAKARETSQRQAWEQTASRIQLLQAQLPTWQERLSTLETKINALNAEAQTIETRRTQHEENLRTQQILLRKHQETRKTAEHEEETTRSTLHHASEELTRWNQRHAVLASQQKTFATLLAKKTPRTSTTDAWTWLAQAPQRQAEVLGSLAELLRLDSQTLTRYGPFLAADLDILVLHRQTSLWPLAEALWQAGIRGVKLWALPPEAISQQTTPQKVTTQKVTPSLATLPEQDAPAPEKQPERLAERLTAANATITTRLFGHLRLHPALHGARPEDLSTTALPTSPQPAGAAASQEAQETDWIDSHGRYHLDHRGVLTLGGSSSTTLQALTLRAENERCQQEAEAAAKSQKHWQERHSTAKEAHQRAKTGVENAKQAISAAERALNELQTEAVRQQDAHTHLDRLRTQWLEQQQQLNHEKQEAQTNLAEWKETQTAQHRTLSTRAAELHQARETEKRAQDALQRCRQALSASQIRKEQAATELRYLAQQEQFLRRAHNETNQRLEALQPRLETAQRTLHEQETQIRTLHTSVSEAEKALEEARAQQHTCQQDQQQRQQQLEAQRRQIGHWRRERETAQQRAHRLELQLRAIETRLTPLEEALEAEPETTPEAPPEAISDRKDATLEPHPGEAPQDSIRTESADPHLLIPSAEDTPKDPARTESVSEPEALATRLDLASAAANRQLKAWQIDLQAVKADLLALEPTVNLAAEAEYQRAAKRCTELEEQRSDLEQASTDLRRSMDHMDLESSERFRATFDAVNVHFGQLFPQVFEGGRARLVLTEADSPLTTGVDIEAQPPGKELQRMSLLSGGEKSLTAIALVFAFFKHRAGPFCLLDEVDAALDAANVTRFARLLQAMSEEVQLIVITHNRRTMEVGKLLYGITMEEAGVSRLISTRWAEDAASSTAADADPGVTPLHPDEAASAQVAS